jgi:hypothetical protein
MLDGWQLVRLLVSVRCVVQKYFDRRKLLSIALAGRRKFYD